VQAVEVHDLRTKPLPEVSPMSGSSVDPVRSNNSCGAAIVLQQTSEPVATLNGAASAVWVHRQPLGKAIGCLPFDGFFRRDNER
jgi:hypothetical protein